jgi:hypothetical protein
MLRFASEEAVAFNLDLIILSCDGRVVTTYGAITAREKAKHTKYGSLGDTLCGRGSFNGGGHRVVLF